VKGNLQKKGEASIIGLDKETILMLGKTD